MRGSRKAKEMWGRGGEGEDNALKILTMRKSPVWIFGLVCFHEAKGEGGQGGVGEGDWGMRLVLMGRIHGAPVL